METVKSEILIENMETVVASPEVVIKIDPTDAEKMIAVPNVVADTVTVEVKMETDETNPKQPEFGERRQDLYSSERFKVELNNLGKFSYGVSIPTSIQRNYYKSNIFVSSRNYENC